MPPKPAWLLRLPRILEALDTLDSPVLDRAALERLFRVGRARAIQLAKQFGGYPVGKSLVVDRVELRERLEALAAGVEFEGEAKRQKRLLETLQKSGDPLSPSAAVRFKVPARRGPREMAELPAGVRFEAGELRVAFDGAEDLLAKLYELVRTIGEDWSGFEATAVRGSTEAI